MFNAEAVNAQDSSIFFSNLEKKNEELIKMANNQKKIFNSIEDPVYVAFEYIDNQPLGRVAADFVKENIKAPIITFISKVSKTLS